MHWLDKYRRYKMPVMAGLIGITISVMMYFAVNQWETQLRKSGFERLAETRSQLFEKEVKWNVIKLKALRQFYDGSQFVDRNEFSHFIEPLHEEIHHPVSFFWAPKLLESDRHSFEKAVQAMGFPGFKIHNDFLNDSLAVFTQHKDYYPILYRCNDAKLALAFNMSSKPYLREAIEKAIDINQPIITAPNMNPHRLNDRFEAILFYPVYTKNLSISTIKDRRLAVEGVVACVIRVADVLDHAIHLLAPVGINMEIADISMTEDRHILYQYKARLRNPDTEVDLTEKSEALDLIYVATFDIADRTWETRVTPSLGYLDTHSIWVCWIVFLGGLLITSLLVIQFYSMQNRTIVIEKLVFDRTVQLQESTERFKDLVQLLPEAVFETDRNFDLTFANQCAFELFGYSDEDMKNGINSIEMIAPKDRNRVISNLALRMEGGNSGAIEYLAQKKDGSTFPILFHASSIIKEGELCGLRGIIIDITERKQTVQKIEQFAAFAKNNPAPMLRTDLEGKITLSNPSAKILFDRDVTGESILSVLSSSVDLFNNPLPYNMPSQFEQQLGDQIYLCSIQKDELTKSVYFYGSNITETKRLQELETRAQRLETAGTIAGQVAHDFNNLIVPMMAYPELIHEVLPQNHEAHDYVDAIQDAAKNMTDINQNLLTMGRRGHFNQKVLDLNQVVLQAINGIESRKKTVTFKTKLCLDLIKIKGGSAQLYRMLTNLLVNAQDAIEDTGQVVVKTENYYSNVTSTVYGCVPKGEYVKLTVSDNGCGISDDIVQKIFDPFFSTKTADNKRGSGLGMSVVDAVIKDHHGYIDLSTKVDEGTSFYIYFPITRELMGNEDLNKICGGSEKILAVDDDDIQREVLTQLLTKLGYEVNTVESGHKAIEFLRENAQDLVILDMIMPNGIDGVETYQQMLKINPHQKAIILSGFSETEKVIEVQKLGAGAFVQKPVTKQIIAAAVRTELDRKAESGTA